MAPIRKIVSEHDINVSAEKYYKIFKHEVNQLPKICSSCIQKIHVHDGDWDSHGHGSIKIWNYTVDGKAEVFKEKVEFNDNKYEVSMNGLEGDVFKHYKIFKPVFRVVPKGPKQCSVILTLEYEKLDDGYTCPYKYLDIMNKMTKDIESHLSDCNVLYV